MTRNDQEITKLEIMIKIIVRNTSSLPKAAKLAVRGDKMMKVTSHVNVITMI